MICVSVGEKKWNKALEIIRNYDFSEIRLDYLDDVSIDIIEKIISKGNKLIATFRKRDGIDEAERLNMLLTAVEKGVSYVDVDINNSDYFISSVLKTASGSKTVSIISYHNYEITPSAKELDKIISDAEKYNPDIIKIACLTETDDDVERLLSLPGDSGNIVIAGMGSRGERLRVLSQSAGSLFTYAAPDNGTATAPGQISFSVLSEKQKRIADEW